MAASQPIEYQQRSYEVSEKKHDMECTTIGVDRKHPGHGTDAQARRQRAHRSPQLVERDAFAMQRRAVGLLEIALARRAGALPPGATTRMPVGTQVPQAQPTSIGTAGMRTEVLRGVDLTRAPMGRGHRIGRPRGRWWRQGGIVFTGSTAGLVGETCQRLELLGTLTPRLDGLG